MKHYKSVPVTQYFEFDRDINKLAKEGYEFVAFYKLEDITRALMVKEVEEADEAMEGEKAEEKPCKRISWWDDPASGDPYSDFMFYVSSAIRERKRLNNVANQRIADNDEKE